MCAHSSFLQEFYYSIAKEPNYSIMFRFAIFALVAVSSVLSLNLKYGNDPSQSLCGDINTIFGKVSAIVAAPPQAAPALASQVGAPNFQRQCSQGQCMYEGSLAQATAHLVRDNFILNSWEVTNVHASYGDFYAKAAGKLHIENKCGDVYKEVAEFTFYCTDATAPGRITQGHTMRTEAPFKVFQQQSMACAQSLMNNAQTSGLRGADAMEIPREHFLA